MLLEEANLAGNVAMVTVGGKRVPAMILVDSEGNPIPMANTWTYVAYASDDEGADFTTVFDADLDYIAVKLSTEPIATPAAADFAGLWKNYKGATGATGAVGMTWKGAWSILTHYVAGDAVSNDGSSYICILAAFEIEPGTTAGWATYWDVLAAGA